MTARRNVGAALLESKRSPRFASGRYCLNGASRLLRGRLLSFDDLPRLAGASALQLVEDGAVWIENGLIVAAGRSAEVATQAPADSAIDDHAGKLILPGFIDTHIHYPQTRVIGSYGAQLLDWLQKYTFVEEQKFSDRAHADIVARFFWTKCSARGRRRRRSIARSARNPSMRSSPRASAAARG